MGRSVRSLVDLNSLYESIIRTFTSGKTHRSGVGKPKIGVQRKSYRNQESIANGFSDIDYILVISRSSTSYLSNLATRALRSRSKRRSSGELIKRKRRPKQRSRYPTKPKNPTHGYNK